MHVKGDSIRPLIRGPLEGYKLTVTQVIIGKREQSPEQGWG